jgi:hypothetical protein
MDGWIIVNCQLLLIVNWMDGLLLIVNYCELSIIVNCQLSIINC